MATREFLQAQFVVPLAMAIVVAASGMPAFAQNGGSATSVQAHVVTDPVAHAIDVSGERFPDGSARHAVVVSDEQFADALAVTPLLGDGPLLLVGADMTDRSAVQAELDRLFPDGGQVYLAGGSQVVPWEPTGHDVTRLAGPTRVETSVAVAELVVALYGQEQSLHPLLVRADGTGSAAFADSLSVGGWAAERRAAPVLFTSTESLHPSVEAFLRDGHSMAGLSIIGGVEAISDSVVAQAADAAEVTPTRIAGPTRDTTAAEVDRALWGDDAYGGHHVIEGYHEASWTWGLVSAGLSADDDAPILLSSRAGVPDSTAERITADVDSGPVSLTGYFDDEPVDLVEQLRIAVDGRPVRYLPGALEVVSVEGTVVGPVLREYVDRGVIKSFESDETFDRVGYADVEVGQERRLADVLLEDPRIAAAYRVIVHQAESGP